MSALRSEVIFLHAVYTLRCSQQQSRFVLFFISFVHLKNTQCRWCMQSSLSNKHSLILSYHGPCRRVFFIGILETEEDLKLLEIYHLLTASTDILLRWYMKLCYLKTCRSILTFNHLFFLASVSFSLKFHFSFWPQVLRVRWHRWRLLKG